MLFRSVPGRESRRRRSFETPGNPLTGGSVGSFGISEGNILVGHKKKTQITCLTMTPSGEVAQMLTSAISKWGLSREAQAALLKVRTGPECPEGNLRELT